MTGFGNPRYEGSSSGGTGSAVTSPKSLLSSIGNKAGFGNNAPFMRNQVFAAPDCISLHRTLARRRANQVV